MLVQTSGVVPNHIVDDVGFVRSKPGDYVLSESEKLTLAAIEQTEINWLLLNCDKAPQQKADS